MNFFEQIGKWFFAPERGSNQTGESMQIEAREREVKKRTKKNYIKSFFNPKEFLKGIGLLKGKNNLSKFFNDKEKEFLNNPHLSSETQADVYVKSKLLWHIANDIMYATTLTDEERKKIEKEYGKNEEGFNPVSKDEFIRTRYKGKSVSKDTIDKDYNAYVNTMSARKKIYKGNIQLALTTEYNKQATEVRQLAEQVMSSMLEGKMPNDDKTIAAIQQELNDKYNSLIYSGKNEADAYNYPLQVDEIVAHSRIKSKLKGKSTVGKWFMQAIGDDAIADVERTDNESRNGEQSMYTFIQDKMSDLQKEDVEKYKSQKDYNRDKTIEAMFQIASGNLYDGFELDEDGNPIYKFKNLEDGAENFVGLKGFNEWRKDVAGGKGNYLEDLFKDQDKLEELAVTYQVIKEKQGEEAANQWLQERFQHYASEGISGGRQLWNSSVGFVKDVVGDAAEIVGGVWGVGSGLAQGLWNSAFSDESMSQVWTDAVGQAFDNSITRWGSDLSSTGYWDYSKQNKARELGLSIDDNIMDPTKANDFLFKGGGSGIGYFLGETGRQASHTMFAVWSGGLLGKLGGKGGALLVKALRGTQAAMQVGYRVGSTLGLMVAGSNEGIMDGIQVKLDVLKQGTQAVDQEFTERAIFDKLSQNVDVEDNVALAKFLQQNHVGDQQQQDENGNLVTVNNLIQQDENGNPVVSMNNRQLVELLKNSAYGQQIIQDYKNRPDVVEEYNNMIKDVENSAIRNGAMTAVVENWINGSIRGYNAGARANIRGAERQFRRRQAAMVINRQGQVNISRVGASFALRQSGQNALHEAVEEGAQNITQTTFTAVGNNSIRRNIDNVYDTNTWRGLIEEWGAVTSDVVTNAGAGLLDQQTYEAAIQGALGSLMGFANFRKANNRLGFKMTWEGSVFNIRSTAREENDARRDMAQALQQQINGNRPKNEETEARDGMQQAAQDAIQQNGGVQALMSMTATRHAIDTYNNAVERDPNNKHANNELAADALAHNVSTLAFIRNTEYGQMVYAHLDYQSQMLGEDFENSEMSQDEINRQRLERAKEFLTTQVEGEELTSRKNAALVEVQEWIKRTGGQVRSIEEIAENPTDVEAQALVDIVMTAKQTREMAETMTKIEEENSYNVQGLNFVAKNELNAKTLLLQNQQQRLKRANDRLTRIAEQNSPTSNTTLTTEQKQSIAILGNTEEQRNKNKATYEEDKKKNKEKITKLKKELKVTKKNLFDAVVDGNGLLEIRYRAEKKALEDQMEFAEHQLKIIEDNLTKDKKSMWDRLKGVKEADELIDSQRILTAYDILTLTPHERAMMLDPRNKDNYSEEQLDQIAEARQLLVSGNATDLIEQTNVLQTNVTMNSQDINDILTNINKYNEHVANCENMFRTNVLNYRYQQDVEREMDVNEVHDFMDRLNEDVEKGLISEKEKNQLIKRARENEKNRVQGQEDNTDIKQGWANYDKIRNQDRRIGATFRNSNIVVEDPNRFDNLVTHFLSNEVRMTLEDFNNLSQQEKEDLLRNSEVLGIGDNIQEINNYIQFAADILHKYEEATANSNRTDQDIARGNNNGGVAEERIVQDNEEEPIENSESSPTKNKRNPEILQHRTSTDNSPAFGSRINKIINYLQDDVLSDPKIGENELYKRTATNLLEVVKGIGMSDTQITSMNQLYQMVEDMIDDADTRNTWAEVLHVMKIRDTQQAQQSNAFRDTILNNDRSASSSTMETQSVSQIRRNPVKKPILDFLNRYSYDEAVREASRMSQGSTGLGPQIFYVTDPTTTQLYRTQLGEEYNDANNLPIFTCVQVSENYKGTSIPIQSGNQTIYVVPIGVLEENTADTQNARGILYTQAIRNLAAQQINTTNDAVAVTVNNGPLTSLPQNWQNYMSRENSPNYTGRTSILQEVQGFGNQVKSAVNFIIGKLKVGQLGNRKNQIYYDNGEAEHLLPKIRSAGLAELQDATKQVSITEILGNTNTDLKWEIDNPIIRMFYNNVLTSDKSFVNIIKSRQHLQEVFDNGNINALNEAINAALSKSFWIGSYNGEKQWKYEIDAEKLAEGQFILRAVPVAQQKEGQIEGTQELDENALNSKEIILLNFTKLFDESGNLALTTTHANTILQNLLFDANGNTRTRDGYGTSFAQVQLSKTVIERANGVFKGDDLNLSEESKQQIQKNNQSVLSSLIEGGGLLVEGSIDNSIDHIAVRAPIVFDKNRNVVAGQSNNAAQQAVITQLQGNLGAPTLDIQSDQRRESLTRDQYISVQEYKNSEEAKQSTNSKTSMWATTLANWLTGFSWEKRKRQNEEQQTSISAESTKNDDITFAVGTNTDLIFRHVLWTSRFNSNVQEKDGLKKIPLDSSETGEGFYTDQELENQFGFHASQVKATAKAFNSYLNYLENSRNYTFVTNVIKPQANIEVVDKKTGKKYTVPVAGELDMLAIDQNGQLHPIDFKTKKVNKAQLEILRSEDADKRAKAVRNMLGSSYETYKRQVNLYQTALVQKGFNVGQGFLLVVPVDYTDDSSVKADIRGDSEYKNSTLSYEDGSPYLEGLGTLETIDNGNEIIPAAMLTEVPIDFDSKFQIDMQDILYMANNDVNFLRQNPEFAEAINQIKTENVNKAKIEIKLPKQTTQQQSSSFVPTISDGSYVPTKKKKKNKPQSTEQSVQQQPQQAKNLALGKTQGNFNEVSRHITQLESERVFDENIDQIEFIVDGEHRTFTVKQMKDYISRLEKQAKRTNTTVEEIFNNKTVEEICTDMRCMG